MGRLLENPIFFNYFQSEVFFQNVTLEKNYYFMKIHHNQKYRKKGPYSITDYLVTKSNILPKEYTT